MSIQAPVDAIRQVTSARLPTGRGAFQVLGFEREFQQGPWIRHEAAVALLLGDLRSSPPLVRIHSQCLTGDVFGSLRCDCGEQLRMALDRIADEGAGLLIYEEQEGRGIGILPKLLAYELQDHGCDTVESNEKLGFRADYRDYRLAAAILDQLGIRSLRLLTNNPQKVEALERAGIAVLERIPCEPPPGEFAATYLKTKKEKMGHLLTLV